MKKPIAQIVRFFLWLIAGWVFLGLIIGGSGWIFEALIDRFGPEFFVGAEYVVRDGNGDVWYTNPGAIIRWQALIALAECLLAGVSIYGAFLLRRRLRKRHCKNKEGA